MPKESRLSQDAEIFQKREPKTEKQKFRELDGKGKVLYFKDYYLLKLIAGIAIVSFIIYMVYTMFFKPRIDTVLYMAIVNNYFPEGAIAEFESEIGGVLSIDPKSQEVMVDDTYFMGENNSNYTSQQKLITYIYSGTVDVVIADEEYFRNMARKGQLLDLSELLPTETCVKLSDQLFMETMEEDTREKIYGIYLGESETYKSLGGIEENPLIGVVANTKYKENASKIIHYLYGL